MRDMAMSARAPPALEHSAVDVDRGREERCDVDLGQRVLHHVGQLLEVRPHLLLEGHGARRPVGSVPPHLWRVLHHARRLTRGVVVRHAGLHQGDLVPPRLRPQFHALAAVLEERVLRD
jgi:hypothetical protein